MRTSVRSHEPRLARRTARIRPLDRGDRGRGRPPPFHGGLLGQQAWAGLAVRGEACAQGAGHARGAADAGRRGPHAAAAGRALGGRVSRGAALASEVRHADGPRTRRVARRGRRPRGSPELPQSRLHRVRHQRPRRPVPLQALSCGAGVGAAAPGEGDPHPGGRRMLPALRLLPLRGRAAIPATSTQTASRSSSRRRGSPARSKRLAPRSRSASCCAPTVMPKSRPESLPSSTTLRRPRRFAITPIGGNSIGRMLGC